MALLELAAMLEMGVIEESNSAWCCPIVLVAKKVGTIICSRWPRCSSLCGRRGSWPTQRSVHLDGERYGIWGTTWVVGRCIPR